MIEIVRYQENGGGRMLVRLVQCPACGADLRPPDGDWSLSSVPQHVAEHDPEDFGLAPLGDRR